MTTYFTRHMSGQNKNSRYLRSFVRALLNLGSELLFVIEDLLHLLSLSQKSATIPLLGIGGTFSDALRAPFILNFTLQLMSPILMHYKYIFSRD